ncbi:polysaccharide lyase family 8 super-sandwich domain-containing protein [Echinicola vietnamensis]|uniref:Polysaccharide lyase family 8,polysaccharide lyase family 8 n=1 Tax=Echinicola vietnamensis (strain DSM 17526 / LMG 23754 / KMM 6221) TaxID=926556 RepID=L0G076_ECHVK|nr:polysaccharide lyase family 8 super-sandwich domain-containing protein [Echinicola vietnamensis]AGA78416.1 polysaccharide lyase family 8,polysaccharide lyase family 8 [Echinicola vietnamensis DSM 17526]
MRWKKLLVLVWLGLSIQVPLLAQNDFDIIMDRIFADFQRIPSTSSLDSQVASLRASMDVDGSWPDIDYTDQSQTNWQPVKHYERVSVLAKAYSRQGSSYYGDASVLADITDAMNYWLGLTPVPYSTNWWFLSIKVPKDIGNILIALRNAPVGIDQALENSMITWMTKGVSMTVSPGKDGSNLTDIGQHYIMRACLTEDSALMQHAVTETGNSIKVSSGEGIKRDHSYMAHGAQLYIYGYGREYVSGIRNIAVNITGTSYAYPPEKIAIFSDFVRKGFIKTSRGGFADFNAFGRSITRSGVGRADVNLIEQVRNFDLPAYQASYDTVIARMRGQEAPDYGVTPEHRHYWQTDYTIHHRPGYMVGLRTVSVRTVKSEMGNGENIKGHFLTDGATYIAVDGDEYFGIYPVWDWNKVPGTTTPAWTSFPARSSWGTNPGKSSFVGGVSDGEYGASVYDMNDYSTRAKKAWFFFDDEVVCLGAGIYSSSAEAINTTVNQTLLKGNVVADVGAGGVSLGAGEHAYQDDLKWVWHRDVGYVFPDGGHLKLSTQSQTGTWNSINQTQSTAEVSEEVFKLWFEHGETPVDDGYAYVLLPGATTQETADFDVQRFTILANADTVQAVGHPALDMVQVVLYEPGEYDLNGLQLNVNQPCVLILRDAGTAEVKVTAADPSQGNAGKLRVGLKNESFSDMKMVDLEWPAGDLSGSSVGGTIDQQSPAFEELTLPQTLEAVADAFVRDGSYADTNYPTGNLVVKKDGPGYSRESFLKFNSAILSNQLDSVKLRLWVNNANTTVTDTNWEIYHVADDSWQETAITWNTKPVQDSLLGHIPGVPAGQYVTLDVTEAVLESLSGDGVFSVTVKGTFQGSKTDAQFASREDANPAHRPVLVVYKTIAPGGESGSLPAIADTFVQKIDANGDAGNKNFGAAGFLAAQNGGYDREVYLKFSVSDLTSPVQEATLHLYSLGAAGSSSWELYSLEDVSWEEGIGNWQGNSEEGLTWNTKPTGGTLLHSLQGTTQGGPVVIDITGYLQQVVTQQDTIAFRVTSSVPGVYTSFASRDGSDASRYPSIQYVLEPEPDTVLRKPAPKNNVLLFPNPLEGMGTITSERIIRQVVIRKRSGEVLMEHNAVDGHTYELDLSGMKNGLYYVLIIGDDYTEVRKAIKRN